MLAEDVPVCSCDNPLHEGEHSVLRPFAGLTSGRMTYLCAKCGQPVSVILDGRKDPRYHDLCTPEGSDVR